MDMDSTVIFPTFFRYEPRGYFVFTEVRDAFKVAEEIARNNLQDPFTDPLIPISNSQLLNLEKTVLDAAQTFHGKHFAPVFFKDMKKRIYIIRQMVKAINDKRSFSDKMSKSTKAITATTHKYANNDFLVHQIKEGKRLLQLALKHRSIWQDGLHTIELDGEKIAGTAFKCVICYEEFDLNPHAKKAWPKACRDYPTCSQYCSRVLETTARQSLEFLEKDLVKSVEDAIETNTDNIYDIKERILGMLSLTFEECVDCQAKAVRVDEDAFKAFHSEYGTNISTYKGRCHTCLGVFLPARDRKKDFFKPKKPKRNPMRIFKTIGDFLGKAFNVFWFLVKLIVVLLVVIIVGAAILSGGG